jgi:hypothetical protein
MSFSTNFGKESSYIFRGESSWSGEVKIYRFPPSPEFSQKLYSSQTFAVLEVKELVQKLAKVENIARVRAVAQNAPDPHIIDIELELQPETELSAEDWDKVQDLVIELEWKLRADTGEKWFFNAEEVEAFSKVVDGAEVVEQYPIHRSKFFKTSFSEPKVQTKDYSIV